MTAFGWGTVRHDNQLVVLLTQAVLHRDGLSSAALWWNREASPHLFHTERALEALRMAAAVIARLIHNDLDVKERNDLVFRVRKAMAVME